MRKPIFIATLAALVLPLLVLAAPSWAAKRVALVIGNSEYKHAPGLANPLNDAGDIGAALDRLGFEVTRLDNADYDGLRRGLRAFTRAASTAEVAVVFYAGHGIEIDQRNFLVPVDARLASDRDVEFEAVPLDLVMRAIEPASGLRLIVLDACRDNPFAAAMKRSGATRSIGRGLARVEPAGETLVAYAAKGGSVAADGEGRNSPFSTALLAHLEEPGLEVGLMFRKVRDTVLAATGRQQEPFVYGSLSSKGFYLSAPPAPGTSEPEGRTESVVKSDEQLFWETVKVSRDPADLQAYLEQFPEGVFAALAHNRIKQLSDPLAQVEDDPQTAEAMLGLKRPERERVQFALWASGFDPGSRDGLAFDRKTREAIGQWQVALGKTSTGFLDVDGAKALLELAPDLSGGIWSVAANKPCKLWNPGPQPGETVAWSGDCQDGKASGKGRAVWKSARGEEEYSGHYREGRKHGSGSAKFADGTRYEGEWRDDRQHGKGARILADGTRYEGEWENGRVPNRGVITWRSGNRYEGDFVDGKRTGRGVFTWADGNRYEGDFRSGKQTGRGVYTGPNGDRYEGDYRDDKRHGRGVYTWPSGNRYEGDFKDGKRTGRGVYTWADGDRYEGDFQSDKRTGRGVYTWADGDRYEGDFVDSTFHGRGITYYKSGSRHEGDYRLGRPNGRGTFTFSGGRRYEGQWRQGCFRDGGKELWAHTTKKACGFE